MGEQSHPLITGHLWSPIMRSSRVKLFISIAVVGTLCFIVFFLRNTHSHLKQLEYVNEKCQQQRDSLSAQLQVVYEHKNRLETSWQQEKTNHKHTQDKYDEVHNKQEEELKLHAEKEAILKKQISELKSNNAELESDRKRIEDSLKEQMESLQAQKEEELKRLQAQVNELLTDKDKIEQARSALAWKIEHHSSEMSLCRLQKQQLKENLSKCEDDLKQSKTTNAKISLGLTSSQIQTNKDQTQNKISASQVKPSPNDKPSVLERPHVQQPEENKNADIKKEVKDSLNDINSIKLPAPEENAGELKNDSHINMKHQLPLPLLLKNSVVLEDKKDDVYPANKIDLHGISKAPLNEQPEVDNLPQVQPPENQPAEKGEYINGILPGQLEQPDFKDNNHIDEHGAASNLKKNVLPPPNINEQGANDAAQVQDMLDKSPGDTNDIHDNRILIHQPHNFHDSIDRVNLNKEVHLAKARAELPDDKQYADEDDDDQDGDNEEEMGAGAGQPIRGKVFHERDFDEQELNENNAKEEEGVVVAPK